MNLRVAAIQMNSQADKSHNLATALALCEQAVQSQATFIALPEVFLARIPKGSPRSVAEPIPGPATQALCDFARTHQVTLLAGSMIELGQDDALYNTSVLISETGEIVATYRKCHLFDVDLGGTQIRESDQFRAGSE